MKIDGTFQTLYKKKTETSVKKQEKKGQKEKERKKREADINLMAIIVIKSSIIGGNNTIKYNENLRKKRGSRQFPLFCSTVTR